MKLENKIALVTGASQGLGKAIALKLAENGADIAVIYVGPEEPALAVCREIEAMGRRARAYFCDVREEEAVNNTVKAVTEDLGKIHILVNNAGVTRDGLLVKMDEKDYDMVLDINLKGAFLLPGLYAPALWKDHQYQLYCGAGGQCRAGKLCRLQGRAYRHEQVCCQGAGGQGHLLQLHCPWFH